MYWKRMQNLTVFIVLLLLTSCAATPARKSVERATGYSEGSYLRFVDDTPDTVDPQCTSEYYTVPLNIFDRLVEVGSDPESGRSEIVPSLAEWWTVSPDGLRYSFHLREGVTFSDGSPLTASDVGFTFRRLLTHPQACNQDIATSILGARELMEGRATSLEGFSEEGDYDFTFTLAEPYAAFLACLSTPGASILDEALAAILTETPPDRRRGLVRQSPGGDDWHGAVYFSGVDAGNTNAPDGERNLLVGPAALCGP